MSKRTTEQTQAQATSCECSADDTAHGGGGSLIDIDVGTGTGSGSGTNGSLIDLDVAPGGDTGSLVDAQVAGGSILDASVGAGDEYVGIGLKVAALADQGLLDWGSDSLATVDVGSVDAGGLVGSLLDLGHIGLPDLPDIGGILDSSSC